MPTIYVFLSRNKNSSVYPCKSQLYYIKARFKRSKIYRHVFVMHCGLFSASAFTVCAVFFSLRINSTSLSLIYSFCRGA